MTAELAWNCDFCGKAGIIMSSAGILYCKWCRKSYGEQIDLIPYNKENIEETLKKMETELNTQEIQMHFKCGHLNNIDVIELSAEPISYVDWSNTVGPNGTKELCWECYNKSCATAMTDED